VKLDSISPENPGPPLLVSACLVGIPCRYDSGSCPNDQLQALAAQGDVLPLCPEVLGGLPTPRPLAEIQGGDGGDVLEGQAQVVNIEGRDVTAEFLAGAQKALRIIQRWDIKEAVLKARSPSCGVSQIYDGSFSGRLVEGDGVTAALLKREGIIVKSEEEWGLRSRSGGVGGVPASSSSPSSRKPILGKGGSTMRKIVECVPNFSEGRRKEVIDQIVEAIAIVPGIHVLDVQSDADHNRTVVTFVGEPEAVEEAAFRGIGKAAELIDMSLHRGEHPRMGAADVVPFVPIKNVTMEDCVAMARRLGERVGRELDIPVYLYEEAATRPERRNLAEVRRGEYEGIKAEIETKPERTPDFGPQHLGRAGATAIGARPPLIAFNVYLGTDDVEVAKAIARAVRHSSGGLRYVKALGLLVKGQAQVSMNLTDYRQTPVHRVMEMIRREAERYGVSVVESELVGLIPNEALVEAAKSYLQMGGFSPHQILENRLADLIQQG